MHTDDIAWWHSRFGWADLAQHVLETVHGGAALRSEIVVSDGPLVIRRS